VVDEARAVRNIERMQHKAQRAGALLRPHFKTHNSHAVGRLFRDRGVRHITVSSVEMAEYFSRDGWDDITVAFPVNLRAVECLRELAARCSLGLLVDSVQLVERLVAQRVAGARLWIDVDTGYGRTGIPVADAGAIRDVGEAVAAAPGLELAGLLTHAGQTYDASGRREIAAIWSAALDGLTARAGELAAAGFGEVGVSVGDTPGCSLVDDLTGPSEIRPGAFVFNDLQQLRLGSCTADDLAFVVACPVVAAYPERSEVVVQGGAVHLSKDSVLDAGGDPFYGAVMDVADGWSLVDPNDARVVSLSQEHGVIRGRAQALQGIEAGDLVHIVPAHACLAANSLQPAPTTTRSDS
jgi:D-serine deaminase-like pyridoxal phosphate-dependent protein